MRASTIVAGLLMSVALSAGAGGGADADYVKQVEKWRAEHEASYTREYVPLAGLFFLDRGVNTIGSAPGSDVRLPERVPPSIGRIIAANDGVRFEPAPGAPVSLNGRPLTGPVAMRPAADDAPPDRIAIADLAFWLHMSGERKAIRLRDPQGEVARTFTGFRWFPIDPGYRVVGKFLKDPEPREVQIPSLTGDDQTYVTEGLVEFSLAGRTLRMRPMTTRPGRFFFIFRDATSGSQTYEAARFLYSDLQPDGTTVLDFNEAYNPPCAFNPYTTCPLTPPENRLAIPIPAGEMDYVKP